MFFTVLMLQLLGGSGISCRPQVRNELIRDLGIPSNLVDCMMLLPGRLEEQVPIYSMMVMELPIIDGHC